MREKGKRMEKHWARVLITTQGNLQIQCNPYQITNGIFHKTRTKHLKMCMETQKTLNSKSNTEENKQTNKWSWRNQAP